MQLTGIRVAQQPLKQKVTFGSDAAAESKPIQKAVGETGKKLGEAATDVLQKAPTEETKSKKGLIFGGLVALGTLLVGYFVGKSKGCKPENQGAQPLSWLIKFYIPKNRHIAGFLLSSCLKVILEIK